MKYFIIITYLFITSGLFAQEIKYQPVFIDQFTNKAVENYPFSLEKDGIYYSCTKKSNAVKVLETGEYTLCYGLTLNSLLLSRKITIASNKIDTFNLPKFLNYEQYGGGYNLTDSLGTPIGGEIVDYYYNGQIRFKGNFIQGFPDGDLTYYHPNGQVKKHLTLTKTNTCYYSSGTLKSIENFKTQTYRYYYPNEQLKRLKKGKSSKSIEKKYFDSGQLKSVEKPNSYIQYNDDGSVKYETIRREKRKKKAQRGSSNHHYQYELTEYDKNGQSYLVYHYSHTETFVKNRYNFLLIDDLRQVKDIQGMTFYENKKVVLELKFTSVQNGNNYLIYRKEKKEWKEVIMVANPIAYSKYYKEEIDK
jgi:hypothetical protein